MEAESPWNCNDSKGLCFFDIVAICRHERGCHVPIARYVQTPRRMSFPHFALFRALRLKTLGIAAIPRTLFALKFADAGYACWHAADVAVCRSATYGVDCIRRSGILSCAWAPLSLHGMAGSGLTAAGMAASVGGRASAGIRPSHKGNRHELGSTCRRYPWMHACGPRVMGGIVSVESRMMSGWPQMSCEDGMERAKTEERTEPCCMRCSAYSPD